MTLFVDVCVQCIGVTGVAELRRIASVCESESVFQGNKGVKAAKEMQEVGAELEEMVWS